MSWIKALRTSIFFFSWLSYASSSMAASFLRDAEIEDTLRTMTTPILSAAGIPSDSVRIFLINAPSINAFVAGGMNIFIHTGLILNTENPSMLMGVIAHETGHIAGAHISQLKGATEEASLGALFSYILGAAAAIGGAGEVGKAILTGGQNVAMRNLLTHYRSNEQQADQAGISYMESINMPPQGMLQMFELLRRNERQHSGNSDPYLRTHPLTSERIAAMRNAVNASDIKADAVPARYKLMHKRMVAKLYSFLETPEKTFKRYPASDTSESGHLARAVAWFKTPDITKALKEVDLLIKKAPNNAFSYDLKGQILFENGRIDEAIAAYEKAIKLKPNHGMLLSDLGKSYVATGKPELLPKAIHILEKSGRADDSNHKTFHQLAIAYGKLGKIGQSNLSLAKEASLLNKPKDSLLYATHAKEKLKLDSPQYVQAEDIIHESKILLKKNKDK